MTTKTFADVPKEVSRRMAAISMPRKTTPRRVAVPKLLSLILAETFGYLLPPVLLYDDSGSWPPRVTKVDPRYFLGAQA